MQQSSRLHSSVHRLPDYSLYSNAVTQTLIGQRVYKQLHAVHSTVLHCTEDRVPTTKIRQNTLH